MREVIFERLFFIFCLFRVIILWANFNQLMKNHTIRYIWAANSGINARVPTRKAVVRRIKLLMVTILWFSTIYTTKSKTKNTNRDSRDVKKQKPDMQKLLSRRIEPERNIYRGLEAEGRQTFTTAWQTPLNIRL